MKPLWIFLTLLFLVASAQRAPAPIQEVEESPTPAPKEHRQARKPRVAEPETTAKLEKKSAAPRSLQGPARFAGTWHGVMVWGIYGNVDVTLTIDGSATSVNEANRYVSGTRSLTNDGSSVTWHEGSFGSMSWTFTPNPDGRTALVKFTDLFIHSTATFHRSP